MSWPPPDPSTMLHPKAWQVYEDNGWFRLMCPCGLHEARRIAVGDLAHYVCPNVAQDQIFMFDYHRQRLADRQEQMIRHLEYHVAQIAKERQ